MLPCSLNGQHFPYCKPSSGAVWILSYQVGLFSHSLLQALCMTLVNHLVGWTALAMAI